MRPEDIQCPICGYYCLGRGGLGCIDKPKEMEMSKPIICLDFDGVIHSYTSGWKGATCIPDPPVEGALMFMDKALTLGYDVVIHSSRARYWGGIRAMRQWLKQVSGMLWYDTMQAGLENVRFTRWKPAAVVTIDDRAIRFDGTFPEPQEAASLRPWNNASKI